MTTPRGAPTVVDYRTPEYWQAVRRGAGKVDRSTWTPVVIEPMTTVTGTDCASARWYMNNAPEFGWTVRATRARHLQPPANTGNYSGRWAEYATLAVRLLHKERSLSAWGTWRHDPEAGNGKGQWSFDAAMWAYVEGSGRIVILRSYAGSYGLAADEFKAIVKGEAFTPRKKGDTEGKDDVQRKPRKSTPKRVMA